MAISESQKNTKIAVDHLQPENLIVYGSKTGHTAIRELDLDCNVFYLMNRAALRRGVAFDAKKGYNIATKGQEDEDESVMDSEDEQIRRKSRKANAPHDYGTQLGRHEA